MLKTKISIMCEKQKQKLFRIFQMPKFFKFIQILSIIFFALFEFAIYRFKLKYNLFKRDEEDVRDKVVVITGGSQGMGKASATEFAKRGAIVVIGDVNVKEGLKTVQEIKTQTGNQNIKIYPLDLADMSSVQEFAAKVSKDYPKIKILLNNAGIAPTRSNLHRKTKDGFSMIVAVNYLGHFLLTNLLIPNIQKENKPRIVSISSSMQLLSNLDVEDLMMEKSGFGFANMLPYCNTKYCQALFTKELSRIVAPTGVHVYALCPTLVNTQIINGKSKQWISRFWVNIIKKLGISANEAASNFILYCALEKSIEKESGKMYRYRKQHNAANERLDSLLARQLWEKSAALVKLERRLRNLD